MIASGWIVPIIVSLFFTAQTNQKPDVSDLFKGHVGCFVMFDKNMNEYFRYNPSRCAERFLPASTFKIPHAVIALETGVIPDTNYVIKWNGEKYKIKEWMGDQNLASAMKYSVVWFFQEIARRVGRAAEQHYLDTLSYGNKTISDTMDRFWLNNSLKISADEQIEFLRKFYSDSLPVSKRSTETVKSILSKEIHGTSVMRFKTGTGDVGDHYIGWLVGYVEKDGDVYFFAFNVEGADFDSAAQNRDYIPRAVLQRLDVL